MTSPCPAHRPLPRLDLGMTGKVDKEGGSKKFLSMVVMPAWWSATFKVDNKTIDENIGGESDDKLSNEQVHTLLGRSH